MILAIWVVALLAALYVGKRSFGRLREHPALYRRGSDQLLFFLSMRVSSSALSR
jgi:hypothetical protein